MEGIHNSTSAAALAVGLPLTAQNARAQAPGATTPQTIGRTIPPVRFPKPPAISADTTTGVGIDLGTPVVEAVGAEAESRFTGRIPKVNVEVR
jgi:hypothetical protein